MINPKILVEIATTIVTLDDEGILETLVRRDTLPGLLRCTNSYLSQFPNGIIEKELDHLITDGPITLLGRTYRGYASAELVSAAQGLPTPSIFSSTPADEATEVALDLSTIQITFTHQIQVAQGHTISLMDGVTPVQSWTGADIVQSAGNGITLAIAEDLPAETSLVVQLPAGVVTAISNGLPSLALSFTFTTTEE